jgi:hemerythrin-like domain-containing protein
MTTQPDLTTFAVLHRLMREDSRRLADAVARVGELEREVQVPKLARWYAGFQDELHDHHVIEDDIFNPALVERVPTASPLVDRIDADHRNLALLIERVTVALERLANPHASFRAAHAEAVMVTDGLAALLDSHLAFEDGDVVPLFGVHFTGEEYEALEKKAMKLPAPRRLVFTIPWVMQGASEDERRAMLDAAPLPFKLLWYVVRGRYRRIEAAAFTSSVPEPVSV